MSPVEIAILVALIALFLYLRGAKPWYKEVDADIDPYEHDRPIRPMIISEKVISLTTLVIAPAILYFLEVSFHFNPNPFAVKNFIFGEWLFFNFVQILKMIIVRPRPNAIALEKQNGHRKEFGKVDPRLESRQSFPSAHAFLGVYTATFLVLYLQDKLHPKRYLFPSAIQFFIFNVGLLPGFSQGNAYWHHWTDIIAGYIIGLCGAFASYYLMV